MRTVRWSGAHGAPYEKTIYSRRNTPESDGVDYTHGLL